MDEIRKDLTAALVDNELHDEGLKSQLVSRMETDADLKYDYKVQSLVKNLIREKYVSEKHLKKCVKKY